MGVKDQEADTEGTVDFCHWDFPIPTRLGPLSEWVVRSQVADLAKDYLKDARRSLEKAGVPADAIDRWIESGGEDLNGWKWKPGLPREDRLRLLIDFLQAWRVSLSDPQSVELDSEETTEAEIAREKLCLREIVCKYAKIVPRWERLERLSFDDPQLLEASKTFLFGFYRASVVLCASAVETRLKELVPDSKDLFGEKLIAAAEERKLVGGELAEHARYVFRVRNRVAHDNANPESDQAGEILGVARKLVAEM